MERQTLLLLFAFSACCINVAAFDLSIDRKISKNTTTNTFPIKERVDSSRQPAKERILLSLPPVRVKYPMKSGLIRFESELPTMSTQTILYFDDYGFKEATETIGFTPDSAQKIIIHFLSFNRDGYTFTLDLIKRTGERVPTKPQTLQTIDFSSISDDQADEMGIYKDGKDSVLGRQCDVWKIDNPRIKTKGAYWVWKNIALRTDIRFNGARLLINPLEIRENAVIPKELFQIPADIVMVKEED